jgi:hypothetical protein
VADFREQIAAMKADHFNKTMGIGAEPFRSHAQVTAAMNDPRYKADDAYRRGVGERISASIAQGIDPFTAV